MTQDTAQQKAILRQSRMARFVRKTYPAGTPIVAPQTGWTGTVLRHVPMTDAQGGHLVVEWENGEVGRVTPMNVKRDEIYGFRVGTPDYPRGMAGPFSTIGDAREEASRKREMDWPTGAVRKMTQAEFDAQVARIGKVS